MPHVSKRKLPKNIESALEEALTSVFSNLQSNSVSKVFSTLITKTETKMLMKRLAILFLLDENIDIEEIAKAIKTTRQTVARIRLQLLEASEKDKTFVLEKLRKWKKAYQIKNSLKELAEIPQSLSRSEVRKKLSPF